MEAGLILALIYALFMVVGALAGFITAWLIFTG